MKATSIGAIDFIHMEAGANSISLGPVVAPLDAIYAQSVTWNDILGVNADCPRRTSMRDFFGPDIRFFDVFCGWISTSKYRKLAGIYEY